MGAILTGEFLYHPVEPVLRRVERLVQSDRRTEVLKTRRQPFPHRADLEHGRNTDNKQQLEARPEIEELILLRLVHPPAEQDLRRAAADPQYLARQRRDRDGRRGGAESGDEHRDDDRHNDGTEYGN